jgi:hypothetical protein
MVRATPAVSGKLVASRIVLKGQPASPLPVVETEAST